MATKKSLAHLDMNKNEIQNAVIQNLSSDPSSPVEGQIYYKTGDDSLYLDKAAGFTKVLDTADINTSSSLSGASNSNVPSTSAVKTYIDDAIDGRKWLTAVRVMATANVNISNGLENGDTLDGVTLATGDRVCLPLQTTGAENGIYIVSASGAASRSSETGAQLANHAFLVTEGTTNHDTQWVITNESITLGTTTMAFTQIAGGSVPDATTSTKGKVQLATQAEAQAKTDTAKVLTPASVADFPRKYSASISGSTGATISAATHGLGATPDLQVMLFEGSDPYVPVIGSISIAANGNVTWATNQSLTGRIVIIG